MRQQRPDCDVSVTRLQVTVGPGLDSLSGLAVLLDSGQAGPGDSTSLLVISASEVDLFALISLRESAEPVGGSADQGFELQTWMESAATATVI